MSRVIFCFIFALLIWWLHGGIGRYPSPLPRSANHKGEIREVLVLFVMAIVISTADTLSFSPWLQENVPAPTLRELIRIPLLSFIYAGLPLLLVIKKNRWTWKELGFTFRSQSKDVSIFAVAVGTVTGLVAFLTGKSNMGVEALEPGLLVLLFYNNAILEEFFYRGVIQAKLERGVGQPGAIFAGGMIFGMKHLALDITTLLAGSGGMAVLLALLLQTLSGWLLGMIYMKTRSLWPGIICHYLGNWLPSCLLYYQVVFLK